MQIKGQKVTRRQIGVVAGLLLIAGLAGFLAGFHSAASATSDLTNYSFVKYCWKYHYIPSQLRDSAFFAWLPSVLKNDNRTFTAFVCLGDY